MFFIVLWFKNNPSFTRYPTKSQTLKVLDDFWTHGVHILLFICIGKNNIEQEKKIEIVNF